MDGKLSIVSYALAVVSGVLFVSGLALLSNEGREHLWTDSKNYYSH